MGLFKKKNPQDAFDPDVFTITDTILDPPRFTFLPAIYQDATRRKWAACTSGGNRAKDNLLTYGCAAVRDR
ncbi:MAG: hypothetical protein ACLTHL_01150 [Collinsella sp.]